MEIFRQACLPRKQSLNFMVVFSKKVHFERSRRNAHFFLAKNFFVQRLDVFWIFLLSKLFQKFFLSFFQSVCLQVFGGALQPQFSSNSHLSVGFCIVPNFMHLEPPPVLYGCLSTKPWHQRDFAHSTHPPNNEPVPQVLKQVLNLSFSISFLR